MGRGVRYDYRIARRGEGVQEKDAYGEYTPICILQRINQEIVSIQRCNEIITNQQ